LPGSWECTPRQEVSRRGKTNGIWVLKVWRLGGEGRWGKDKGRDKGKWTGPKGVSSGGKVRCGPSR